MKSRKEVSAADSEPGLIYGGGLALARVRWKRFHSIDLLYISAMAAEQRRVDDVRATKVRYFLHFSL
jgi:hypothetical protein